MFPPCFLLSLSSFEMIADRYKTLKSRSLSSAIVLPLKFARSKMNNLSYVVFYVATAAVLDH